MQFKKIIVNQSEYYPKILNLERREFQKDLREIYQSDEQIEAIVTIDEGELVAYTTFKELDESFDIYMLMVREEYRNRHIASMMLETLMYKSIILEVRKSNLKAIKFYKKHGLKQIRVIKNYYENNEDGLVMYKEIE